MPDKRDPSIIRQAYSRILLSSALVMALVVACLFHLAEVTDAQSGRRPVRSPNTPPVKPPTVSTQPASDSPPIVDLTPDRVTADPGEEGTIRVDTSLVTIPVTVTDRQGRLVPNLYKANFRLYEDDVEQRIDSLVAVDVPFNVVLVLDTSGSTSFYHKDIQEAAVMFVDQLRDNDQVMVVSFASRYRVECEFTSDRGKLRDSIRGTRTGGGTRLYEAVDYVLERLESVEGRKAVVLFTDGADTLSRRASASSTIERVEESGAIFYPLSYDTRDTIGIQGNPPRAGVPPILFPNGNSWPFPGGNRRRRPLSQRFDLLGTTQGPGRTPPRLAAEYLLELATRSGGRLSEAGSLESVSNGFSLIAAELRQQYALCYYPGNTSQDGSWRRIRVRVDRPDCAVRSRKGYRAASRQP